MADPAWVDIAESGLLPDHAVDGKTRPHFVQEMLSDRSWAENMSQDIRRGIASAIGLQCVPWHIDYSQFRAHVADWARRVARFLRQALLPIIDGRGSLPDLQAEVRELRDRLSRLEGCVEAIARDRRSPARDREPLVLPGESIPAAIHRAQLRAARSRSPGPYHIGPDAPGWPPNPAAEVVSVIRSTSPRGVLHG